MGLRKRIMLLAAIGMVVATVPLGVMGVSMLRAATDRVLAERLAMIQATAEHLNWRLTRSWEQLETLSRLVVPLWAAGHLDGVRTAVTDVVPHLPLFSGGVFLVDQSGRVVLQAPPAPSLLPADPTAVPAVKQSLIEGRRAISDLIRSMDGVPVVILAVPVRGATGAPVGALGGIINLTDSTLQAFIDGMALGSTGHAAIVGEDGIVLASTDRTELFTRDEHPEFLGRLIREGQALVGAAEDGWSPGNEPRHVMAFAPLATVPWGMAVGQDEEETFGPIRRLRDRIVLFDIGVLAAALLIAWLDTGAVAAPLRLLKDAAERITRGDLTLAIEVRRGDEIGTLARSFEAMRVQLLQSLEEIRRRAAATQSLYEVGTEVLSLRARDTVLQSVAGRAASLLYAEVAAVCLFDEPGSTASVRAVAGSGGAMPDVKRSFAVPPEPTGAECLERMGINPVSLGAHAVEPLIVGGRTLGALVIGTRRGQALDEEQRQVLGGLANLAAIAVENARLQEQVQSTAVLEERERIAREMHDSVGQVLGYVNTKVQAVRVQLGAGRLADAQTLLTQLEETTQQVYADLREAILGLRTETSPERRLVPALHEYVRRFGELSAIATEMVVEGDPARYRLGPIAELHLIRIIQEALTNVRKHAQATRATVRFSEREGILTVSVRDDGHGFDPAHPRSGVAPRFGLQTMRERAEAIGGTFAISSRDGAGTEVQVRVPLQGGSPPDARAAGG